MDIIVPMISGAAGALIKQISDKGVEWLVNIVSSQNTKVQEQIQRNAQNFLVRLSERVSRLESDISINDRHIFDDALGHPSSSLLIRKALVSASATDNDDRHEILSELIAQRLSAGADDMISLAGSAACDITIELSSRHIKILGVMAKMFAIRPSQVPIIDNQKSYDEFLLAWWKTLDELSQGLERANHLDILHLVGLSCVSTSIGSQNISTTIASPLKEVNLKPTIELFEHLVWWPRIMHLWNVGVKSAYLTSVGMLIGTLYHDSIAKRKTAINWD